MQLVAMFRIRTATALLPCLMILSGCTEQAQVATSDAPDLSSITRTSDPEFVREVYESDIPVLVDFGAEWCSPCQMLKPILHDLETEYAGRLKIVAIDTDQEPELASHFEVRYIPTLCLFQQGELVASEGFMEGPQLRQWINANVDLPAEAPAETHESSETEEAPDAEGATHAESEGSATEETAVDAPPDDAAE